VGKRIKLKERERETIELQNLSSMESNCKAIEALPFVSYSLHWIRAIYFPKKANFMK
jgi:hypothetical protein